MNEEILIKELTEAREDAQSLYIELKNILIDHPELKNCYFVIALKNHENLVIKQYKDPWPGRFGV